MNSAMTVGAAVALSDVIHAVNLPAEDRVCPECDGHGDTPSGLSCRACRGGGVVLCRACFSGARAATIIVDSDPCCETCAASVAA